MAKAEQQQSFNPIRFAGESWAELKKVHRPSRQETIATTLVVLVMVFLFATVLGGIDWVIGTIMRNILT